MMPLRPPSRLRTVDWQILTAECVERIYRDEADRWQRLLDWETAPRWEEIEQRRRAGTAPGIAVLNEQGAVVGWCHYTIRHKVLRITTFNAADDRVGQLMAERLLGGAALTYVDRVSLFAFTDYAGLVQAMRAKSLSVDRYWYLGRDTERGTLPLLPALRNWRPADARATAALLERAYGPGTDTRPFAPGGTPDEWTAYVSDLIEGTDGTTLLPEASLCLPAGPDRLVALALVSRIADSTAHLTQLIVDPQMRRRRLATQLLELASAASARAGCRRLTVTVAGGNRPGRALLEGLRFRTMGSFLAAGVFQPRRSTSVAPGAALMTRR